MNTDYTVIYNPRNPFRKHEVWEAGVDGLATGYGTVVKVPYARAIKAFRTQELADQFINYLRDVSAFKQRVGV